MDETSILRTSLEQLRQHLDQQQWQEADELTLELLLEAADRTQVGWLNTDAIAQIPCAVLDDIDQCWHYASGGRFGFYAQLKAYTELDKEAFEFACEADWVMLPVRPLAFFRFYSQLSFDREAPVGHLPALWYWRLPWWRSLLAGGFGSGRGGGFWHPALLDAMMLRLERCQFSAAEPTSGAGSPK